MNPSTLRFGAIAAAAAVAALAAVPAGAGAAGGTTVRLFSHQLSFVIRDAKGHVTSEPKAGGSFTSTDDDYLGNHRKHAAAVYASDHIQCTFTEVDLKHDKLVATCDGEIALPAGMVLTEFQSINLTGEKTAYRLTGGTGKYAHLKSGVATNIAYSEKSNDTDLVIQL